jgi:hypothetical protein
LVADQFRCLQVPEKQVPRTIENTREPDETVCRPDDQEVRMSRYVYFLSECEAVKN